MFGGVQLDPVVPKKPVEETLVEKPQDAESDIVEALEPEVVDPAVSPDGDIAKRRDNKWETRKRTIEIELDGITFSLEAETYDYDYPEKIQQETGILGYERTKISNESLFILLLKPNYVSMISKFKVSNVAISLAQSSHFVKNSQTASKKASNVA